MYILYISSFWNKQKGYAVFPMAIEQEILVAANLRQDQQLELSNVIPTYKDFSCELEHFQ